MTDATQKQLEQAIALQESLRGSLPDEVIEATIAALREKLAVAKNQVPARQFSGERKQVTVMFADISGFTALAEMMDPEAVREMINACFNELVPIVEHYGGTVDKFIGDEIMVLFGAPAAHENDPERALRAALEMGEALKAFNRERGINLALHFGINSGLVVTGGLGSAGRQAYSVLGDAVNLAARLEDAAERDEILVGLTTYRLAERLFDFEEIGPIAVKGKADPVMVHRLLKPKAAPRNVRGIAELGSKLVGREAEFKALQEAVARLSAGSGGIITLVGEAGLGKSRLAAELHAANQEMAWLEGRCLSYGDTIPYLLWQEVVRNWLGVTVETDLTTVQDKLKKRVAQLGTDQFDDLFPFLGRLLSLSLPAAMETMLEGLGAHGLRTGTYRALERLLTELARENVGVILVCEDLHWADPSSIDVLEQLLALSEEQPILFICLLRPRMGHASWQIKETAASQYGQRHIDLELDPLPLSQSEALIAHYLPLADLPPGLIDKIMTHGEGNPFYIEEIIRSLINDQTIEWDEGNGRWHSTRDVSQIAIPDTLQGVLGARIDRLQGETRRILRLAAVIGRTFFYRLLAAIAEQERTLESHLLILQQEQMILKQDHLVELLGEEYIFKHQLTHEAAYRGLLRQERLLFHRQVAEALEGLFPEQLEAQVELLAYHWERAGEDENAIRYLGKAGEKAAGRYANQEALAYFERALFLAQGHSSYDAILFQRAALLLETYQGEEAVKDYRHLLDQARQKEDSQAALQATIGLAGAYYNLALDQPAYADQSLQLYQDAYAQARDMENKRGMVQALLPTMWFTDYVPGYWDEMIANLREARALSQELQDDSLMAASQLALAAREEATVEQLEALTAQLEQEQNLPLLKDAYFPLIWLNLGAGNFERAIACCDRSIELAARLGVEPVMYPSLKGRAYTQLGRYSRAWEALQEEVADEAHAFGKAFQGLGIGDYYYQLGAYEKALAVFEEAGNGMEQVGRPWFRLDALSGQVLSRIGAGSLDERRLARLQEAAAAMGLAFRAVVLSAIALDQGKPEEAWQQAQIAQEQELARDAGSQTVAYVDALLLACRALRQLERPSAIIPLADEGVQIAARMYHRPAIWSLVGLKGWALDRLGQREAADSAYAAAAAIIRELTEEIDDETLQQSFLARQQAAQILTRAGAGTHS